MGLHASYARTLGYGKPARLTLRKYTTRMVWTHPAPESFRIPGIFRISSWIHSGWCPERKESRNSSIEIDTLPYTQSWCKGTEIGGRESKQRPPGYDTTLLPNFYPTNVKDAMWNEFSLHMLLWKSVLSIDRTLLPHDRVLVEHDNIAALCLLRLLLTMEKIQHK